MNENSGNQKTSDDPFLYKSELKAHLSFLDSSQITSKHGFAYKINCNWKVIFK